MRHLAFTTLAIVSVLLPLSSVAKEWPVVSVSSEPTGLTVQSRETGKKMIPGVDIYSDGSVAIRRYDGSQTRKRIDRRAVDRLLESLARTNFYKVTEDSFAAKLKKSGETERVFVTDCPIWTIHARLGGVARSTRFYALWEMAEQYPKNSQLRTLKDAILRIYSAVGETVY